MPSPPTLNCPRCPRQMVYLKTLQHNIHVYTCEVHGDWHLGPGGIYDPASPAAEVLALIEDSR